MKSLQSVLPAESKRHTARNLSVVRTPYPAKRDCLPMCATTPRAGCSSWHHLQTATDFQLRDRLASMRPLYFDMVTVL